MTVKISHVNNVYFNHARWNMKKVMTRAEIAKIIGIHESTLNAKINGDIDINERDVSALKKIMQALVFYVSDNKIILYLKN